MKSYLYSLFFVASLLLWAACAENGSPISGSTEIPNMGKDGRNEDVPYVCASRYHEEVVGDSIVIMDAQGTCFLPPDIILNYEDVPDSCEIEEKINIDSIGIVRNSDEYKSKLDSMSKNKSLDSATRICAQKYSKISTEVELGYEPGWKNRFVKSIRCESGNVYITNGYKQLLKDIGVKNDNDSLNVYTAIENLYSHELDAVFNACLESYSTKKNVVWDASTSNSKTLHDTANGSSITLLGFDSLIGGDTHLEWAIDENLVPKTVVFTLKGMENTPIVSLGIWFDGKDSKKEHKAFDVSDKAGVCFLHYGAGTIEISLDMGDSLNAIAGDNLYATKLEPSNPAHPQCVPWRNFRPHSNDVKIDRTTALSHVTGFRYKFTSGPYWNDPVQFQIEKVYYMEK